MDRSFLSLKSVIEASRRFVCIRTLTYENAAERDFQRTLFIGRSGDVENTTFCFLGPDGKKRISWAGRSIRQVFQSPDQMSQWMNQAASYYDAQRRKEGLKPEPIEALPVVPNVRLAVDTAAADDVPLVVLYGTSPAQISHLKAAAAGLAWKPEFIGRLTYVSTMQASDLGAVQLKAMKPGYLIIQPTKFGLAGKLLTRAEPAATSEQLTSALRQGLQEYQPRFLQGFDYMRAGQQAGAFWETKLPVTDIDEARARERTRSRVPHR
ncbi:MAG TPA: hypothetical protein VFJ58_01720 [Armatimonadota bacterium]|nr:hypothetical protein [Armatimonadota bacterium]